jgi:hypothetical protein
MKSSIYWDKMRYSLLKVKRYFGETCHLHHQIEELITQETSIKK